MEIWTGFTIGLLSGFHCIGMCGPLAMAVPVNRQSSLKKWMGILVYNSGRMITYTFLGFLFGLLGQTFKMSGWQQLFSILLGLAIILVTVIPLISGKNIGGFKIIVPLVGKLKLLMGSMLRNRSFSSLGIIGLLNGLLPCGMVYIGLTVAASTGSALEGSLYMLVFGLGTFPFMIGAQWMGTFINTKSRNAIKKLVPVMILFIGIAMILRGLNLGIPYLSPQLEVKQGHVNACH